MKLPKLNWLLIVFVLSVSAGLLYFGHNQWEQQVVLNPLQEHISLIEGVSAVEVGGKRRELTFAVRLQPEADFPFLASQINELIRREASGYTYRIAWRDNPDEELRAARRRLDLTLQEARWRYRFVELEQRLDELVATEMISYQLGVDDEYIYLSLSSGQHLLQETIPLLQVRSVAK